MEITSNLPPIFCLSLARAVARRAQMTERLNALGVAYEMIDAVDGKELDLSTLTNRLRQDVMRNRYGRSLTLPEIGCYLSHYNLWSHIVANKIESAIIIEDDASFHSDFIAVSSALACIPYNYDVILLHTRPQKKIETVLYKMGDLDYSVCRMQRRQLGTAGYLISLNGAKKLLDYCFEVNQPIDVAYSAYWLSGIKFYAVCPRIIIEDGSASTIATENQQQTIVSFATWMRACMWRRWQKINCYLYNLRNPVIKN